MPAVLREHFDALVLVLVLVLASAVLVLGRAISPVPYLVVSGRSQPMSRSGGDVQRPPRTVVDCEWRLTIKEMRQRMRADDAVYYWLTVLNACCLSPNEYRLMDE